ncbi:MAG: aminotransferase class IV family protein [Deltaproteobacteria bacterium]|nr:aminotransferase class IV family protein [Deltaproteobacteria bacterium]
MLFSDLHGKISKEPPQVSLLDHGFLFGDSLYEVVRVYDRKFFGWKEHMERMVESGKAVGIDVSALLSTLKARAIELLKNLNEPSAAIRIFVTRGVGKLHIDPRSCEKPSIYMAAWKFDVQAQPKHLRLAVTKIRRNSRVALDPAIKSGNYLNNILAFKEAVDYGFDDAILLNVENKITELTTMNLGWIKDGKVFTSSTDTGILHGITRKFLVGLTSVSQGAYGVDALQNADEVFALSTFKEVLPVTAVRFENGEIKEYRSHPKTLELGGVFKNFVQKYLEKESSLF